jgi:hypothetical protein
MLKRLSAELSLPSWMLLGWSRRPGAVQLMLVWTPVLLAVMWTELSPLPKTPYRLPTTRTFTSCKLCRTRMLLPDLLQLRKDLLLLLEVPFKLLAT